jgi:hypothetical protein
MANAEFLIAQVERALKSEHRERVIRKKQSMSVVDTIDWVPDSMVMTRLPSNAIALHKNRSLSPCKDDDDSFSQVSTDSIKNKNPAPCFKINDRMSLIDLEIEVKRSQQALFIL